MTGVKAEQTLFVVATTVKKSTKWALKGKRQPKAVLTLRV
jgi:hypothetical protein